MPVTAHLVTVGVSSGRSPQPRPRPLWALSCPSPGCCSLPLARAGLPFAFHPASWWSLLKLGLNRLPPRRFPPEPRPPQPRPPLPRPRLLQSPLPCWWAAFRLNAPSWSSSALLNLACSAASIRDACGTVGRWPWPRLPEQQCRSPPGRCPRPVLRCVRAVWH